MKTVYVIGSSHAHRIQLVLKGLPEYNTEFNILSFAKGGAKFSNLVWPDLESIDPSDVVLVFPLGNDLLKNRHHIKKQGRIFHLERFEPVEDIVFRTCLYLLEQKLSKCRAKILVVTSFYRHFCCRNHTHQGWLGYQNLRNAQLFYIQDRVPNVTVLNHKKLVSDRNTELRDTVRYRELQYDSVHFRDYTPIARKILPYILG